MNLMNNLVVSYLHHFRAFMSQFFSVLLRPDMSLKEKGKRSYKQAGQMDIIMTVLSVIVGAISLYVGMLILSNVESSLPNETTSTETFSTIESNVNSAFVLIGVGFIVMAAGFIIGALVTSLAPGLFTNEK